MKSIKTQTTSNPIYDLSVDDDDDADADAEPSWLLP